MLQMVTHLVAGLAGSHPERKACCCGIAMSVQHCNGSLGQRQHMRRSISLAEKVSALGNIPEMTAHVAIWQHKTQQSRKDLLNGPEKISVAKKIHETMTCRNTSNIQSESLRQQHMLSSGCEHECMTL